MGWRGERRGLDASETLCWGRVDPQRGGREGGGVVEKERLEAAEMSSKQEGAGGKGRWGGTEGRRCGRAVGSAMKKMMEHKREMEVKRSEVEVWRVRVGPGEQDELGWGERRRPTKVTTHTPVTKLNVGGSRTKLRKKVRHSVEENHVCCTFSQICLHRNHYQK